MRTFPFSFTVLILSFLLSPGHSPASPQIAGGSQVDPRSPLAFSVVALADASGQTFCSGTLISDHALVTAAHCVFGKDATQLRVLFGSNSQLTTVSRNGTASKWPDQYTPYESSLPAARDVFDVALFFFSGGLPAGFKPASLMLTEVSTEDKTKTFSLAGFGGPVVGILKTCDTEVSDPAFSRSEFSMNENAQCSLGGGDSGGPVYRLDQDNVLLYGIHNWGWHHPDGSPLFSVETRMSFYGPWLKQFGF